MSPTGWFVLGIFVGIALTLWFVYDPDEADDPFSDEPEDERPTEPWPND